MRSFFRTLSVVCAMFCGVIFSACTVADCTTPDEISMSPDSGAYFCDYPLTVSVGELPAGLYPGSSGQNTSGEIMLFGVIPVKPVALSITERPVVSLGGQPFGIRLYTDGLIVTDTDTVETSYGRATPARDAGIMRGDILLTADGEPLTSSRQLSGIVEQTAGRAITITGRRGSAAFRKTVTPAMDSVLEMPRLGLWVKDSSAGIGTMTFTDRKNGTFAGLGHGIFDSETGELMPLAQGDIVSAVITGVNKGSGGSPGSLCGSFADSRAEGTIAANSEKGVYGFLGSGYFTGEDIPLAFRQEVKRGKVQIYTTVNGTEPEFYDAEITDISYDSREATKNIVLRITDERLLSVSGGIVQGMSGSPVIQDGCLVGAVTHVFVNDPTGGYAVFAESMYERCKSVSQKSELKTP